MSEGKHEMASNGKVRAFVEATIERAVKTFAQAELAQLGAGAVDIVHISWQHQLSISAGAALVSVLTSLASASFGSSDGPSLVGEKLAPEAARPAA